MTRLRHESKTLAKAALFRPTSWLLLLTLLSVGSCARQETPKVTVQGTVLYQGRPLREGVVAFVSDPQRNAHRVLAVGKIDMDGRFTLHANDAAGLLPGWYRVSVLSTGELRLPEHYSDPDRSGLLCEIPPQPEHNVCLRLE